MLDRTRTDKTITFSNVTTTVNGETGLIEQEKTEQSFRINPEPPYVKMYIDDICDIVNAPASLKPLLILALRKLDYDGYISLSTRYRRQMCESLGIKDGTLRNRLNMLVKHGFFKSVGGSEYKVNPYYFARGDWKNIVEQRRDFELKIRYSSTGEKTIETVAIPNEQITC